MHYCLALDLRDDPAVLAEYDRYHREVWPEVLAHLRASGIHDMTIWRRENRLVMLIDAPEDFRPEQLAIGAGTPARVKEWETLMSYFQQPLPHSTKIEWTPLAQVFRLNSA
ncbi:L-rhamnose mutarotase [Paraburkholderia sp. BCC1885]|uniref:L-rhamnose mutarotase n=1 Tax=Paraburkholderia sp. BCC1885 TaxID=2562669 RepID=UPI001181CAE0|nr:L-rhamnose mutarotase [Paraburkholderia sp. BCC1885]